MVDRCGSVWDMTSQAALTEAINTLPLVPLSPVDTTTIPFDTSSYEALRMADEHFKTAEWLERQMHDLEMKLEQARRNYAEHLELAYCRELQAQAIHERANYSSQW